MPKTIEQEQILRFDLFKRLTPEELRYVQESCQIRTLEEGEVLLLEGQTSDSLYFVHSGWLKAEKVSFEGRSQVLRFIGPDEIINELSVFSKQPSAMSVIALDAAIVFSVPGAVIEQLMHTNRALSRCVIQSLAMRIQHLVTHVENLSFYPVETRLARFLLAEAHGKIVLRQSWKTQAEIASRLGTVLEVLNRQLQDFERKSLIEVGRDQIIIKDQPGLERIARR